MAKLESNGITAAPLDRAAQGGAGKLTFGALTSGDRFIALGALWTKIGYDTARKHSKESRALGKKGFGYHGDALCSFEQTDAVEFVPVS